MLKLFRTARTVAKTAMRAALLKARQQATNLLTSGKVRELAQCEAWDGRKLAVAAAKQEAQSRFCVYRLAGTLQLALAAAGEKVEKALGRAEQSDQKVTTCSQSDCKEGGF